MPVVQAKSFIEQTRNLPLPPKWNSSLKIKPGLHFQMYISAMHGGTDELKRHLTNARELDVQAILHSGPRHLQANCVRYANYMRDAELLPQFAFGLDGQQDSDGTRLTAKEKGQIIGGVLKTTGAKVGVEDEEGGWDIDEGPLDETDELGALELGEEARKLAPIEEGYELFDQLWFAIESHGDERSQDKVLGDGGSFRGFPSDELAKHLNGRLPQPYWCNNRRAHPEDAYTHMFNWMYRDWQQHELGLLQLDEIQAKTAQEKGLPVPPSLVLPRSVTVQGYGHERAPWELVHCLINWMPDRPVFMWCEPWPSEITIRCIKVARKILALGFRGNLAVAEFQRSTNGKLTVDNKAGLVETFKYLGL